MDPKKEQQFFQSNAWPTDMSLSVFELVDSNDPEGESKARSFSGGERNRLFIQTEDNFKDASLISGADTRNDGRGFALVDFNRDGLLDIVAPSPLYPRLQIFKNQMVDPQNRSAFVALQGGHTGTTPQSKWSSRDPVGATFVVTIGDRKQKYQVSCGEGLSSQNSKWIHIGMGKAEAIDSIEIQWPAGNRTSHSNIVAGSRTVLKENGRQESFSADQPVDVTRMSTQIGSE